MDTVLKKEAQKYVKPDLMGQKRAPSPFNQLRTVDVIFIGSDHGGFELKQCLKEFLKSKGHSVVDVGPQSYNKDDDYPDYAERLCSEVIAKDAKGILICKSGHGMAIVANKFPGVYASVCWSEESAIKGKKDDNLNVLCLPGEMVTQDAAKGIVSAWLETRYERIDRRNRRMDKVREIERRNFK